jgi:hypothetical protein
MTHKPMLMPVLRRGTAFLLLTMMMSLLNSCSAHRLVQRPVDSSLDPGGHDIRLFWRDQTFALCQASVKDEVLSGVLQEPRFEKVATFEFTPGSSRASRAPDELYDAEAARKVGAGILQVFVDRSFQLVPDGEPAPGRTAAIPFAHISMVQVVENDTGLAIVKTFGAVVLAAGIAFVIILATKDSCPFIYVQNGDEEVLVGEIYSGAIHPPMERDDYLALPVAGDGDCQLRITNEVLEVQHTNLAELLVLDHAKGERVLVDRHGTPHRLADTKAPVTARSLSGSDILDLVAADDGVPFIDGGRAPDLDPQARANIDMDGMILTFDRPAGAQQLKLVVNARNSTWLDHVMSVLFERMGDQFKPWQQAQKNGSAAAMQQWCRDQGLPLAVSVQTPDGWRRVDQFDLPGPIADRDAVLAVDLAGIEGDQVTVKLECGYRFWEIDRVTADFTAAPPPAMTKVGLARAVTGDGRDVTADLLADDALYLHQPNVGDAAALTYHLSRLAKGQARSVILHSKGHYDILRDPMGQPEAAFVASFRQPGRMTGFSRELFHELSGSGSR